MLSRVAENLFWMGRYVERTEHLARLLEDAFYLELDASAAGLGGKQPLEIVLEMFDTPDGFARWKRGLAKRDVPERDLILRYLTFARSDGASIRSIVSLARENARGTQDAISAEVWNQLNQFYLYLTSARAMANFEASSLRFYSRVLRECMLFNAFVDNVLPRAEAFHFFQLGRYLERMEMACRILSARCEMADPEQTAENGEVERSSSTYLWRSLLRGCAAYEAYLQQAESRVEPRGVVRYMILEPNTPRSVRFGTTRCLESLNCLGEGGDYVGSSLAERQLGRLDGELRYADIDEIFNRGVCRFLNQILDISHATSQALHQVYFRT